ncbi:MAG: GAF domain-containing sensor histidine kinase [Spirochaetales bacterium]
MKSRLTLALNELISLIRDIGTVYDLSDVLKRAADVVARVLPANRVTIIIVNREERAVEYFCEGGHGAGDTVEFSYDEFENSPAGWVLEHQTSTRSDTGSSLVVPLLVGGTVRGTMSVNNRADQSAFTADDGTVLEIVGNFCSAAFEKTAEVLRGQQVSAALETANLLLRHETDLKTKLFSILAHDLRGPMGNVREALRLLVDGPEFEASDRLELLALTADSADKAYGLTENVLGWIQNQLDHDPERFVDTSLAEAVDQVITWLAPLAVKKSIRLAAETSPEHRFFADAGSVAAIVRNLASNAIKFSPAGTTVTLRTLRDDVMTCVEVQDQGVGIPQEKAQGLFSRAKNDSTKGTSGEAGSGLGLMFCCDLAQSFGGILEVESEVGRGSLFRLVVPNGSGTDNGGMEF